MYNDVPGRVEEWHILSVQLQSGLLNPKNIARLSDVECSVVLWFLFVIGSALTYLRLFQALLHMSRYITACDSVLPGLSLRQYCKQQTLG